MPETLMRWIIAVICTVATLALMRESMLLNYVSWRGQGGDAATSEALGNISLAFDAFKSVLPVVIAWAWRQHRRAAVIAAIFFCGCLSFSLYGALGLADASRGKMSGNREAKQLRHAAAERELRDIEKQIAALGTARPATVIGQLIEQSKQDRRWAGSGQCATPTNDSMRGYCREIAVLRTELASSIVIEQLSAQAKVLQTEISSLLASGVRTKLDGHAEIVAKLLGFPLESIQTSRSLLVTVLLEFGAAFGFFIAALPLVTRHGGRLDVIPPPQRPEPLKLKPTRFVREGGRLLTK